ncbi:MAG: hypothetical protein FJ009_04085 [Chloroflexi bacterium]|nr:hypothetical protein [Chloroflexota bacterium]
MKTFVRYALLALVLVAVLVACAPAPTPTPLPKPTDAPKPTATPLVKFPFRLNWTLYGEHAAFFVAFEKGFYKTSYSLSSPKIMPRGK